MTDEHTTLPLIRTKLYRPPVTKDHLYRERLLDRLEKNRQQPLTLISAPAGYGKSTLLSGWLESCNVPSAWVSLDDNDNDLRVFLAYLLAAVQTKFPAAGQKTAALLNSSKQERGVKNEKNPVSIHNAYSLNHRCPRTGTRQNR